MKKVIGFSLAIAAGLAALPAAAVDETRTYITGGYGYVFDDKDRGSQDGEGGWIGVGTALSKRWGLEGSMFYNRFDASGSNATLWREVGVKLDSMFFISRDSDFSPYVSLGVGALNTRLNPVDLDDTDPMADFGVGFFSYVGFLRDINLGIRGDVRYRVVNPDIPGVSNFDERVVRIGLSLPLGEADAADAAEEAAAEQAAASGASATGAKDSDGDGVIDDKDKCPGTARGLTVDANGCPLADAKAGPNRSFENVNFAYDKSELTDYAKGILDNAAGVIGGLVDKYPKLKVDVSGHTDWVGTDGYNQALSERRANTVKQYLTGKGVDAKRINTFSYGESKPVAPNDTDEGRAINRRAEIRTHE